MDTLILALCIIAVVFGVLQIILFFKVWAMTNNVDNLTKHITQENETLEDALRYSLLGEWDQAKKVVNRLFVSEVITIRNKAYDSGMTTAQSRSSLYKDEYKELEELYTDHLKRLQIPGIIDFRRFDSLNKIDAFFPLYDQPVIDEE